MISHADRYGESSDEAASRLDPVVWLDADLDPASFTSSREEAELSLAACISVFLPHRHSR
jgi:hypothetical protein